MKYRIFDKLRGRYLTKKEGFVYPDGELKVDDVGEYIVEECTGLKDKNGKLIWEGDIIELTRARNYGYIPKGSRLVIKWNTFDCCGFSTGIRGNLTKKCADNCIIVGNIHENPDLL